MNTALSEQTVRDALARVVDPEIPTCSIADLGIIERVTVTREAIEVDLLPTFSGCPALDVIRIEVERAVHLIAPDAETRVRFVMSPPWTTDRITPAGHEALKRFGISQPGVPAVLQIGRAQPVACPYCGSTQTSEESAFGPTPCRSVRYCTSCKNPFEGFKVKQLS